MEIVLTLHSLLRWFVLLFGLWTFINAVKGFTAKSAYTQKDNRTNLLFMISCDVQLLVGLVLYIANGWASHMKDMKDSYFRFFAMEHFLMMLIALALVHIGRAKVKKAATDIAKHKLSLIFVGIAIVLILVSIPWPIRELVGRPLFRF